MTARASTDTSFERLVLAKCQDALEDVGFTRIGKNSIGKRISDDFNCWTGLNVGRRDACVEINPFVGVHAVSIERMWTSLMAEKYSVSYRRGVATYAVHMGELAPKEPVFNFQPDSNVDVQVTRLATLYMRVGLPYAVSIASFVELLPLLESRIESLGAYPERFACCLYLMGRKGEARTFVEQFSSLHRDYFEGFAVPFLKRLDSERVN